VSSSSRKPTLTLQSDPAREKEGENCKGEKGGVFLPEEKGPPVLLWKKEKKKVVADPPIGRKGGPAACQKKRGTAYPLSEKVRGPAREARYGKRVESVFRGRGKGVSPH